jgi:hypothetical protein
VTRRFLCRSHPARRAKPADLPVELPVKFEMAVKQAAAPPKSMLNLRLRIGSPPVNDFAVGRISDWRRAVSGQVEPLATG